MPRQQKMNNEIPVVVRMRVGRWVYGTWRGRLRAQCHAALAELVLAEG